MAYAQTVPGFLAGKSYAAGSGATAAATGDFNHDGRLDMVVANASGQSVSVLIGTGNGAFKTAVNYTVGGSPTSVAVGDFNGDGKLDIAVANGSVSILLGNGDGTFQPALGTLLSATFVATADFNLDHKLDLVTVSATAVSVGLGNGDGTFQTPIDVPLSNLTGPLAVGDFNGDGMPDLAVTTRFAVVALLGNGDGTFVVSQGNVGSSPGPVAVGDFNGDGKLDLAIAYIPLSSSTPGEISINFGNGDGTFQPIPFFSFTIGQFLGNVVVADFNGDGKLDVAVKSLNIASIAVLYGNGDGTLQAPVNVPTVTPLTNFIAAADLDRNHSPDLIEVTPATSNIMVLRNTRGNPPLLALLNLNPTGVVSGTSSQGSVFLGAAAPPASATVTLTSSNSAVAFFPSGSAVNIPAGADNASFTIGTGSVTVSTKVMISAVWNGVTQRAALTVVPPFSLVSLAMNPTSLLGNNTSEGTVTLSGPTAQDTMVTLSSANTGAVVVPSSVTVPAGKRTATFTAAAQPVSADTPVTLSATLSGVTQTAVLTVLKSQDVVAVTRAEQSISTLVLTLEATSTKSTAVLMAYRSDTGQLIGTLTNSGGGKYKGQFTLTSTLNNVTVKSNLGGLGSSPVTPKH